MARKPLVSSLTMSFRKATMTEDVTQAKKEHRETLFNLVNKYIQDVQEGKAEGIRNAKELVEVIKMDLLLMGEATERTDTTTLDEVHIQKMSQYIDENDPAIQSLMEQMLMGLNNINDDEDVASSKQQQEIAQAELSKFTSEAMEEGIDYEAMQEDEE